MNQLTPQDSQFLYLETKENHIHVTSVFIFDPASIPGKRGFSFDRVREHVEQRLHLSALSRRCLVRVPMELDFPYWADDDEFDIDYHIRHERLPAPADWLELCNQVAQYHSRQLDMTRPLWEMVVMEGLDDVKGLPRDSFAIITKVHHAAADGTSLIRFFASLLDADRDGTPAVPLDAYEAEPAEMPGLLEMTGRAIWNAVRSPIGMTDAVMRSAPNLYRLAQNMLSSQRETRNPVPDTRFNCIVSPHKVFDASIFDLDKIKAIRQAIPGSTVNDVVLCICAGALREYLENHDELPDESLVAWIPINARSGEKSDDGNLGNNVTSMTSRIFTDIEDPLLRLGRIKESTSQSKVAKSGISARLMTDLSQHVPAATLVTASRLVLQAGMAARMCNLFISNVPGPQVPMYMAGAEQVVTFGAAPLADGMGLFIATPSYNGKITFNVTSTRETLPDIRFFTACIVHSFESLSRATETSHLQSA